MTDRSKHPDTRPGDVVGTDDSGRVRIDRVIPLQWVMGIIGAGVINAAAMYYGQQQLIEKVGEMRTEIKAITSAIIAASNRDIEHSMRLQTLEQRVTQMENRK